ncbi:alpha-D-xyloside xylohydrolase [Haloactinopolyspora alba]|uniref:Alpha-D-xyloside xylohydrolase n=1 Tax=Haloactinopolyspora alba TaxID=648780 RepID=A0A2P8EBU2_9ACTN|nr:TIM-barrel domain-containing protein [Haloactinopolyspora alba]PSL06907.1 alpha-D-xyloside xylohydrolase [Haloactinopolyspora alba]
MVSFHRTPNGLEVRHRHEVLTIEAWGADSVRVRAAQYRIPSESHGALDVAPAADPPAIDVDDGSARIVHGELTVDVTFDREAPYPEPLLTFTRTSTGAELLAESREHFWLPGARHFQGNRSGAYEIHQRFAAYPDERLYGLGQRTHGRLDIKGLTLDLVQRNAEVSIPFVLSSRGYGLLWNIPAVGRVEFAENGTRWQAGQAREIDYWITAAPTPAGILARYADATGHAPDLPAWASGFWQSKLRYLDQEELLGVAREHRRRGLPLSVVVTDYFHWSAMGDYRFDPAEWPDPRAMVAELAQMDVELMVSVWPTVSPLSENFAEFRDRGLLVGSDQGVEFHQTIQDKGMAAPMPVAFYDPTNPATRQYVWDLIRRNYLDHGIRVFWLDASEPELNPAHPQNLTMYAGPGAEVANIYPRDNARLFAEGMATSGREPTVLLCRSAWAGSQRYGAAVWSGDIPATWESLRRQLRAGLNIAISGIPWWTTDIGGFHGGDARDPAYRELMIRWFQYGVFCPLFRLHGDREPRTPTSYAQTGGPNEIWSYGDEAHEIISGLLQLRERLRPYIHEQMTAASRAGLPPMRPLFVDHPADPRAWDVDDEFLFGPDILVAPVTHPGQRSRRVYLPAGTRWVDAATGEAVDGGRTREVDSPIDRIPVFTREGADIPLSA